MEIAIGIFFIAIVAGSGLVFLLILLYWLIRRGKKN
jgi:hypothetical protein